jgi:hypothetical protein
MAAKESSFGRGVEIAGIDRETKARRCSELPVRPGQVYDAGAWRTRFQHSTTQPKIRTGCFQLRLDLTRACQSIRCSSRAALEVLESNQGRIWSDRVVVLPVVFRRNAFPSTPKTVDGVSRLWTRVSVLGIDVSGN